MARSFRPERPTHRQNGQKWVLGVLGFCPKDGTNLSALSARSFVRPYPGAIDIMGFKTTARGDRIDWPTVRDRLDLAQVATALLGPAPDRRGERGRRLWWRCPFHEDANPSFGIDPGKPWWKCWGCGEHGDAAALVMSCKGWHSPRRSVGLPSKPASSRPRDRGSRPARGPRPPAPQGPREAARGSLGVAAGRCPGVGRGRRATPLDARGDRRPGIPRREGTDRRDDPPARLGWVPRVMIPNRRRSWLLASLGITIPWHDAGRLALVKIRQPEGVDAEIR